MKRKWMAMGLLASALLFAACGGGDLAGDDDDSGGNRAYTADRDAAEAPQSIVKSGATTAGGASASAPGGETDTTLPSIDAGRKVIFTATMALNATDVGRAFNAASSVAIGNGGYVEKASFTNDEKDNTRRSASLTLRIPSQNYDQALAALRSLDGVTVASEGVTSNEVTEQYIDLQSTQRNLERTEQQYLELLKQAKSIQEIITVQDRLTSVRNQIEQIQGRLKVLDQRVDFATVNVTIAPVVAQVKEPNGSDWTLKGVFSGSLERSLETARYAVAAAIVFGVAMAWLVVPMAIALTLVLRHRKHAPASPPPPVQPA